MMLEDGRFHLLTAKQMLNLLVEYYSGFTSVDCVLQAYFLTLWSPGVPGYWAPGVLVVRGVFQHSNSARS